ncbi:MAG: hypothetical protein R3B47_19920 [Bacteroidia bacterium]
MMLAEPPRDSLAPFRLQYNRARADGSRRKILIEVAAQARRFDRHPGVGTYLMDSYGCVSAENTEKLSAEEADLPERSQFAMGRRKNFRPDEPCMAGCRCARD